jgi:hypothetical protein
MPNLDTSSIFVSSSPNAEPMPYLASLNDTHFEIEFNCSCGLEKECTHKNYFNKARVEIDSTYSFSFLINCDPDKRHKQF